MHYAVPKMLHQAGMLERFYTDAYIGDKPILERALRFIPNKNMPLMLKKFLMRKEPDIPANKVVSFDIFGIHFLMKMRRLTNVERAYHYFANKMKQFNELIISRGLGDSNVVFGFDGASLELFLYAKKRGLVCMLE
ncbi:MAG: hypothetical protein GTN53_35415, partial [Candidatus Aminicenantes bacterium]|nr:hypothetical protein [Candidatus Aminicenantes bacterium]NIT27804.1 hypothetical protein [Candidatus Aminicenantes bacterium]